MIWITQWLCPKRHCSIALLWDPAGTNAAAIEAQGEAVYKDGAVNRHCGICGEGLAPEVKPTSFQSMHEAELAGGLVEALNMLSRVAVENLKSENKN